jgi:hypothetical protein
LGGGFSSSTTPAGPVPNKYLGTACPNGQESVGGGQAVGGGNKYVLCVPIKQAAPAPAPAPKITVAPVITTAVSPNLQQQFTPQISPVFQQSSGSGGQSAGTTQEAGGGQSGAGGGSAGPGAAVPTTGTGMTSSDLLAILNAQAEQARLAREAQSASEAQRYREQQEYYAQQRQQQDAAAVAQAAQVADAANRAAAQQAAMAVHSQYTGPSPREAVTDSAPTGAQFPAIAQPSKNRYTVPIAGVVILAVAAGVYMARKKGKKR